MSLERPASDDVYERVTFRHLRSGNRRDGVMGWREGPACWVSLQVWDGPSASAVAASLSRAFARARLKLLLRGYWPAIDRKALPVGLGQ